MKTIKEMFIENNDYYFDLQLTNKYHVFIEGVGENYINLNGTEFDINKIKFINVELNDNEGSICEPVFNLNNLDITCNELKEMLIDTFIDSSIF